MQVTYFLNGTMLRQSDFLWEIQPQSYPWNPNCLEKFILAMLLMEVLKCWNVFEFQKLSVKMNNPKTYFYGAQTVSHLLEVIQPTTRLKLLTDIYGNIQTFASPVFRECSSWASRNGAVQIFFLTPTRNMFAGKCLKWVGIPLCCGSIFLTMLSMLRLVK